MHRWTTVALRIARAIAVLPLVTCDPGASTDAEPDPPTDIVVVPHSVTMAPSHAVQFRAYALDASGDSVAAEVRWGASAGTITQEGRYTASDWPGTDLVVATHEPTDVADTAAVTVMPPAVASVEVSPSSANLSEGETVQLTASVHDADGNILSGRAVTWTTSDAGVARVSERGLVTGVAAGSATITATSESESGTADITVTAPAAFVFVGAGDIADCGTSTDAATADLLDDIPGTVFTLGDNAYPDGSTSDFADCYEPTWGRHKNRTRPTPGNHDYDTPGASAYFAYFGTSAGDPDEGYYSFDLGAWHIVALNSNISMSAGSAQEQWLRADLAASGPCTLAYWHHPRFSSGSHGNDASSGPLWDALYDAGAELVLVGHDHNYERFAPQTPSGDADPTNGIRQFVVGTGGTNLRSMNSPVANSEVQNSDSHGVLKLTLTDGAYTWEFVPIAGQTFTDQGSGECH